ncbi:unnamed protein product, partial [Amoebophrya sp. A120]|eukprot:GSA120T00011011001.1
MRSGSSSGLPLQAAAPGGPLGTTTTHPGGRKLCFSRFLGRTLTILLTAGNAANDLGTSTNMGLLRPALAKEQLQEPSSGATPRGNNYNPAAAPPRTQKEHLQQATFPFPKLPLPVLSQTAVEDSALLAGIRRHEAKMRELLQYGKVVHPGGGQTNRKGRGMAAMESHASRENANHDMAGAKEMKRQMKTRTLKHHWNNKNATAVADSGSRSPRRSLTHHDDLNPDYPDMKYVEFRGDRIDRKDERPTSLCLSLFAPDHDHCTRNPITNGQAQVTLPLLPAGCKDDPGCNSCVQLMIAGAVYYAGVHCDTPNACATGQSGVSCQQAAHLAVYYSNYYKELRTIGQNTGPESVSPHFVTDTRHWQHFLPVGVCRDSTGELPKLSDGTTTAAYDGSYRRFEGRNTGSCGEPVSVLQPPCSSIYSSGCSAALDRTFTWPVHGGDQNLQVSPTGDPYETAALTAQRYCDANRGTCQGFYVSKIPHRGWWAAYGLGATHSFRFIRPLSSTDKIQSSPETYKPQVGMSTVSAASCSTGGVYISEHGATVEFDLYVRAVGALSCPEWVEGIEKLAGGTDEKQGCGPAYQNRVCSNKENGYCNEATGRCEATPPTADAVGRAFAGTYTRTELWDFYSYPGCTDTSTGSFTHDGQVFGNKWFTEAFYNTGQMVLQTAEVLSWGVCDINTDERDEVERRVEVPFAAGLQSTCEGDFPACSNTCPTAFNGVCEDGGADAEVAANAAFVGVDPPRSKGGNQVGAVKFRCPRGTDCADCGVRAGVWRRVFHSRLECGMDPDPVTSQASMSQELETVFGGTNHDTYDYYARVRICRRGAWRVHPHLEGEFPGDCLETLATLNVGHHLGSWPGVVPAFHGIQDGALPPASPTEVCSVNCLAAHPDLGKLDMGGTAGAAQTHAYQQPVHQWRASKRVRPMTFGANADTLMKHLVYDKKQSSLYENGLYDGGSSSSLRVTYGSTTQCAANVPTGFAEAAWGVTAAPALPLHAPVDAEDDSVAVYLSCPSGYPATTASPRASCTAAGTCRPGELIGTLPWYAEAAETKFYLTYRYDAYLGTTGNDCVTNADYVRDTIAPKIKQGLVQFVKSQTFDQTSGAVDSYVSMYHDAAAGQLLDDETAIFPALFSLRFDSTCESVSLGNTPAAREYYGVLHVGPFNSERDALVVKAVLDGASQGTPRYVQRLHTAAKSAVETQVESAAPSLAFSHGVTALQSNGVGDVPALTAIPKWDASAYDPDPKYAAFQTNAAGVGDYAVRWKLGLFMRLPSEICPTSDDSGARAKLEKPLAYAVYNFLREFGQGKKQQAGKPEAVRALSYLTQSDVRLAECDCEAVAAGTKAWQFFTVEVFGLINGADAANLAGLFALADGVGASETVQKALVQGLEAHLTTYLSGLAADMYPPALLPVVQTDFKTGGMFDFYDAQSFGNTDVQNPSVYQQLVTTSTS